MTQTENGEVVVLVTFHRNIFDNLNAVVRRFKKQTPRSYLPGVDEVFYYELEDLDEQFSSIKVEDLPGIRVVLLKGALNACLVSVMKEGYEHD